MIFGLTTGESMTITFLAGIPFALCVGLVILAVILDKVQSIRHHKPIVMLFNKCPYNSTMAAMDQPIYYRVIRRTWQWRTFELLIDNNIELPNAEIVPIYIEHHVCQDGVYCPAERFIIEYRDKLYFAQLNYFAHVDFDSQYSTVRRHMGEFSIWK